MIPLPAGCRVWIATGHTDMRRGMQGLALQVQEQLKRDPHAGDLYIFRGRRGDLAKILWHDGVGLSLYAKRLDRGKFIWPWRMRARFRSRRRRWPICSRGSTGGIHSSPSGRKARVSAEKIRGRLDFGAPQIAGNMIHFASWTPKPSPSRRKRRAESAARRRARQASEDMALIAAQKLQIAKLQRQDL